MTSPFPQPKTGQEGLQPGKNGVSWTPGAVPTGAVGQEGEEYEEGSPRNPGGQQRVLVRQVSLLLRVLWVLHGHRPWHWDYVWDLAAAGTMCTGTLHRSRRPSQQPSLKDMCIPLDRPPPE